MEIFSEEAGKESIANLPDEALTSAIAFHLDSSIDRNNEWFSEALKLKPGLALNALEEYWRPQLAKDSQHIPGLYRLRNEEFMRGIAGDLTLTLLRDFPNCKETHLETLLISALLHADQEKFLLLARENLGRKRQVLGLKRVMWVVSAFLLNPDEWMHRINYYIRGEKARQGLFFIKDVNDAGGEGLLSELPSPALAVLSKLFGSEFKPYSFVSREGAVDWSLHDASTMITRIIEWLSNRIGDQPFSLLTQLKRSTRMAAWQSHISHSLQLNLRKTRELTFKPPTLKEVIDTLNMGPPANTGDLHALVCDHLNQIADDIEHDSTNRYKIFWNVDKYSRPAKPRPENDGRDNILHWLKDRLMPSGVDAQREGSYARDNRADIRVSYHQMNVPIEIKRHYHAELWSAINDQLILKYSRDPGAKGWGIFLVLWFGLDQGKVPEPPRGISPPNSIDDLRKALQSLVPLEHQNQIEVACINCSK